MSKKQINLYLYVGLLFFSIFLIAQLFYPLGHNMKLPLDVMASFFPLWFLLVYAIIIAPVIEEYIFRSWQPVRDKRKWIAPVLMILFVASVDIPVWTITCLLFVFAYWIFYKRFRTTYTVLGTAFLFSVIHLPDDMASVDFYLFLSGYIGLALIFSFIRLRYTLGMAMLVHGIWNFLALFVLNYNAFYFQHTDYSLSTDTDRIEISRFSIFESAKGSSRTFAPDKISTSGSSKKEILSGLIQLTDPNTILVFETNSFTRYAAEIHSHTGGAINRLLVLQKLIPVLGIGMDTSYRSMKAYILYFPESAALSDSQQSSDIRPGEITYYGASDGFAHTLQQRYQIPVSTPDTLSVTVTYNELSSFPTTLKELESHYGIHYQTEIKEMRVIRVYDIAPEK